MAKFWKFWDKTQFFWTIFFLNVKSPVYYLWQIIDWCFGRPDYVPFFLSFYSNPSLRQSSFFLLFLFIFVFTFLSDWLKLMLTECEMKREKDWLICLQKAYFLPPIWTLYRLLYFGSLFILEFSWHVYLKYIYLHTLCA